MAALAFSKLFDTKNHFKRVRLDDLVVNKTVTMSKEPINNLFFCIADDSQCIPSFQKPYDTLCSTYAIKVIQAWIDMRVKLQYSSEDYWLDYF